MDWYMALYALCSVAGLLMVLGSLFLLWKGRIYLDNEGQSVTTFEVPMGIKFSTQFPVLIMFLFGAVLLVYPVYYAKNVCPDPSLHARRFPVMVTMTGKVISSKPIDVYAVVDESDKVQNDLTLSVPFKEDARYRVMYSNDKGEIIPSDPFRLPKDSLVFALRDIKVESSMTAGAGTDKAAAAPLIIEPDKNKETDFK